jgi:hypothetical protein
LLTNALPALAKSLEFKVTYKIESLAWGSNWTCLPGCEQFGGFHSLHERAEFAVGSKQPGGMLPGHDTLYTFKIPRRGAVDAFHTGNDDTATPFHFVNSDYAWTLSGKVWQQDNPNTPFTCVADRIEPSHGADAALLSSSGSVGGDLKLDLQLVGDNPVGSIFSPYTVLAEEGSCNGLNGHWAMFYPVGWGSLSKQDGGHGARDMFTASLRVPLSKLRGMGLHDHYGWSFRQGKAKYHPRYDCAVNSQEMCNETLQWTGSVSFERTG